MKKILILCLVSMLVVSFAQATFAEETDSKWAHYNAESKNPWLAVGAAWLLPSLGHAYAGDWIRSWPFVTAEITGLALTLSAAGTYQGATVSSVSTTGLVIFAAARIWEYFDAYYTAEDTNKKLKEKYNLTINFRENLPVLAFNYSF